MEFVEFSEIIERACYNSWRTVLGRDKEDTIAKINSVLFTMNDKGDIWEYSFALRIDKKWYQSKIEMPPVEYDIYEPAPFFDVDANKSPQNIASEKAIEILNTIAGEING